MVLNACLTLLYSCLMLFHDLLEVKQGECGTNDDIYDSSVVGTLRDAERSRAALTVSHILRCRLAGGT